MFEDTTPEARERYLRHLREMSPADRFLKMCRMNADARALKRAWLREKHPAASDEEIHIRLAALLYGRQAASILGPVPEDAVVPLDLERP